LEIAATGEGSASVPLDERNAVYQGVVRAYARAGKTPGRLRLAIDSQIPLASGLGSSSAALIAGLAAGTELCGIGLDREEILRQGVAVEGHPDNVAPCALGGIVIAALDGEEVAWARIEPPRDLAAVVAIPDFPLPTPKSRSVLPERVERRDAIFNAGRVGLLVAALQRGDYSLLRTGMQDRLHQPYRTALVPGLEAVLAAATEAGALGAALSGAGPTALALVNGQGAEVAGAMQKAWAKEGIAARTLVLGLAAEGVQCVKER
jgi:homoserine kinase